MNKFLAVSAALVTLLVSGQSSANWDFSGNLVVYPAQAKTFVLASADAYDYVTDFHVSAFIYEEGTEQDSNGNLCTRIFTDQEFTCSETATDNDVSGGCEYCGKGNVQVLSANPTEFGNWGHNPTVCEEAEGMGQ